MTVETTANIKVDKDMASWRSVAGCTGKRRTIFHESPSGIKPGLFSFIKAHSLMECACHLHFQSFFN